PEPMKVERRNDLSLRLLEIFGALMRKRTTTGAAEDLGISQPAVSNAIKALEKQLGFVLFERVNRRLVPTEEAHLLLAETEPAFAVLRNIETEVRDLRRGRAGRLRLAATPPLGHTVVPAALKAFLAEREKVTVSYNVRRLETVVQSVETGIADIGLVLGHPLSDTLRVRSLSRERLVCVMPQAHPLARLDIVTPDAIDLAELIGLETSIGATVESAYADAGCPYRPRIVARYCHTACILAEAGLGVAIVDPFSAFFSRGLDLAIRPFEPACEAEAVAIERSEAPRSKLNEAFLTLIADMIQPAFAAKSQPS
ncbi:MAG: LysR family transcriptional regulator, partial [Pseudomonadota bacterium]